MKRIVILAILFCATASVRAQDFAAERALGQKIVQQIGNLMRPYTHLPLPTFVITPDTTVVAKYERNFKTKQDYIIISTKTWHLCRSFGNDATIALAILIAHELRHHYGGHYDRAFLQDSSSLCAYEWEADSIGLLQAYIAGYPTFDVLPALIENVYRAFKLPDRLKGYPDKQKRLQLASHLRSQLQHIAPVADVALLISLFGYNKESFLAHDYLLRSGYTFPPVYLNAAVALLKSQHIHQHIPFLLPVLIDDRNPMRASDANCENLACLDIAEKYLTYLNDQYPDYYAATINVASRYCLQGMPEKALALRKKLENLPDTALLPKAKQVLAVAYALNQDSAKAHKILEQQRNYSPQDLYNYNIFHQIPAMRPTTSCQTFFNPKHWKIGETLPDILPQQTKVIDLFRSGDASDYLRLKCGVHQGNAHYFHIITPQKRLTLWKTEQVSFKNHTWKAGDSISTIAQDLNCVPTTQQTPQGYVFVFDEYRFAVFTDHQQQATAFALCF